MDLELRDRFVLLTSSSPLAVGHRLRGKGKDSYRV